MCGVSAAADGVVMQQTIVLTPCEPPFSDEAARVIGDWMPPDAGLPPLALFRLLARSPQLADSLRPMARHFLRPGHLPSSEREVLILRTTARAACEYEWGVNAAHFASAVGLDRPVLDAVSTHPDSSAEALSSWTRTLVRAADELYDGAVLSPATLRALAAHYDQAQILELIALCGWYRTVAGIANSACLDPEPWAARLPQSDQS